MKKLLLVANVAKEHINKFHLPTIRYFKSQGWQVDVACGGEEEVPGCDHRYHGKWQRSPFRIGTILGILQLRNILNQENYDVVYCHTAVGGLVARMAVASLKKKPKVAYFAHGFHFYKGGPIATWLAVYPMEKFLSRYTDLLITLNNEDYALACEKLASNAKVFLSPGIGVDFARLNLADKGATRRKYRAEFGVENKTVLVYVAELHTNKNQGMLLAVLKKLSEKRDDFVLVLVGPDYAEGHYQREAERLGLEDKVIFTGWRSDIGALLSMADIYVASSIREGLAVNLVEAMYMGLPIVATCGRGHDMIITDGETGFLVPQNDANSMAKRILRLMEDSAMRDKFAHADIRKYDAASIACRLYEEINALA